MNLEGQLLDLQIHHKLCVIPLPAFVLKKVLNPEPCYLFLTLILVYIFEKKLTTRWSFRQIPSDVDCSYQKR